LGSWFFNKLVEAKADALALIPCINFPSATILLR